MSNPKASVVMPVYNAEEYLSEAIESVLSQSYIDFEFIIINDCSSDSSPEIIRQFEEKDNRIRVIHNDTNLKITRSLNKGIEEANGEYIIRMDADDICEKQRFDVQIKFMDQHPQFGVCGSQAKILGTDKYFFKTFYQKDDEIRASLLIGTGIIHPTTIIRKSVLDKLEIKYNPEFDYSDDIDLWFRISLISKLANIPDVLLQYRSHEKNWTRTYKESIKEDISRLRKKIYSSFLNYKIDRSELAIINERKPRSSIQLIKFYAKIFNHFNSSELKTGLNSNSLSRVLLNNVLLKSINSGKLELKCFLIYFSNFFLVNYQFDILKDWLYWGIKRGKFLKKGN